jgi:protein-tyrosine phosphatase
MNVLFMSSKDATSFGRIDVHSHLLPDVDDGCPTVEESLRCVQRLISAGYTHGFCTPHIWPNLPHNSVEKIVEKTKQLQADIDAAGLQYRVMPGGELNVRPDLPDTAPEEVPTFCMGRKYCLFDIWVDVIPKYFWTATEWLQSLGLQVILAHPERMRAVQDKPELAERFQEAGLLLQGNLQCLGDPPNSYTRRVAERYLKEGRYFLLGSDTHNAAGLDIRLAGLENATDLVGDAEIWRLTRDNPLKLIA